MSVQRYAKKAVKAYIKQTPGLYKRYKVYKPALSQLASDVMYLKGLINSEPKAFQVATNNNVNWAGAVISCNNIPQGDGYTFREGDRVLPRFLGLHMTFNRTSTATTAHQEVRVIVFRWWGESPNAAGIAPVPEDIIQYVGTQDAARSFLDDQVVGPKGDRCRRVEVLRNYYKTLSADDSQLDVWENIEMNGKNVQRKEHIEFYDSTTNPPTSGGIFILVITDNSLSEVAYHISAKTTFYDN